MKRVSKKALQKLYSGLEGVQNLCLWWKKGHEEGSLESLLWVLFVAWSVARMDSKTQYHVRMPPFFAAPFFLSRLKEVALELALDRQEKLEKALKVFPWVEHFCSEPCAALWTEIVNSQEPGTDTAKEPLYNVFLTESTGPINVFDDETTNEMAIIHDRL